MNTNKSTQAQPAERYIDRFPGLPTHQMFTTELLAEATRLENMDERDRLDSIRYDFVRSELRARNVIN